MSFDYDVYVSGPITGDDGEASPAHCAHMEAVARTLREGGEDVFNPLSVFNGNRGYPRKAYFEVDYGALIRSVSIYLLQGWQHSPGAISELLMAVNLGREVRFEDGVDWAQWTDAVSGTKAGTVERAHAALRFACAHHLPQAGPVPQSELLPLQDWDTAATDLLTTAQHIVHGDRQRTYGHPVEHHTRTAKLWSAFVGHYFEPSDVSLMFILDKLSRAAGGSKPDTILDIAGYAQVHAMVKAETQ